MITLIMVVQIHQFNHTNQNEKNLKSFNQGYIYPMLIRIVKMTFLSEKVNEFITAFESRKDLIGNFEGCSGVELLRDIQQPNIFFTYSKWQNEQALEKYRQSQLFQSTWEEVKKWFNDKPEAWSLESVSVS